MPGNVYRIPPCRECNGDGEGAVERAYRTSACEHCSGSGECDCSECVNERAEREACGDLS